MNKNPSAIFTPSGCLTGEVLMLFVSGSMQGAELAMAKQHIAECPLCTDAADGLIMWLRDANTGEPHKEFHTRTNLINERVKQRIHAHEITEAAEKQSLPDRPFVWFAVAAAIILFMGIGFVFWMQNQNTTKLQAQKQLKEREAAFIAQTFENLAHPPSESRAILNVKYIREKGSHIPPVVTIVNENVALYSETSSPNESRTGKTSDETEYTETVDGVESDVFREDYGMYKGKNARNALTVKYSGGSMKKTESDEEISSVFIHVQQMPSFPGGDAARKKYLAKHLRYPAQAAENGIEGTIYVSFIVKTDGRITNVKLLRGIGGGCDEEAIRVISRMPVWNPGFLNGKKVEVRYNMPVHFKLK